MASRFKVRVPRWWWIGLCIAAVALSVAIVQYPDYCSTNAPCANRGNNGLWLRYYWYFGKKTRAETKQTAQLLRDNQIRYAFFHVLDVTPEGKLRHQKLNEARKLVTDFHELSPDTKLVAWISAGDMYPAHGTPLGNEGVIPNMVQAAAWLVNDCGFDGVQWDYERNRENDPNFVKLLDETKRSLPSDKLLSIASPLCRTDGFGWNPSYFGEICKHCDQIAIMGYDSFSLFPWSYRHLMSQQVALVTATVYTAHSPCKLLIGVPTYQRSDIPMHDLVETLKVALIGVRDGLATPEANGSVFEGVAPFAEYTTDESEWKTYRELWLCEKGARQ